MRMMMMMIAVARVTSVLAEVSCRPKFPVGQTWVLIIIF
jgi:hypothetical protein